MRPTRNPNAQTGLIIGGWVREGQIMPALEAALKGALKGDTRQFTLSAKEDPDLRLDITRLARVLGHPGETMILEVEIL